MPGNTVVINNGWKHFYVGDSVMSKVLEVLNGKGFDITKEEESDELNDSK